MGWQSRAAALTALWLLAGAPALADVTQGSDSNVQSSVKPPSPFGDDPHGIYDQHSGCWVWDPVALPNSVGDALLQIFTTDARCAGKALDGAASLDWTTGRRRGEVWKGEFHDGRMTGTATRQYSDARFEGHYADGLLDGQTLLTFNDGGRLERNFADGLQEGVEINSFAKGGKVESHFEKGQRVGLMIQTFPDGSGFEFPAPPPRPTSLPIGTRITADGTRLAGAYTPPHIDFANSPPLTYPPIAQRLGEEGNVEVFMKVSADGSVHDVALARSSGSSRLDESALTQIATFRFFPGTLDGKPVDTMVLFSQRFSLRS